MRLQGSDGTVLSTVRADSEVSVHQTALGGPRTGNNAVDIYPSYELMSVSGVREVLEFKNMEPVFYVVDDPEIINRVEAAAAER
jgi:hypothetical protein